MSEQGLPPIPPADRGRSADAAAPMPAKVVLGCLIMLTLAALVLGGSIWWMLRGVTTDPAKAAAVAGEILELEFPEGIQPLGALERGAVTMVWAGSEARRDEGLHMVLLETTNPSEEWRARATESGFFQREQEETELTERPGFRVRGAELPAVHRRYANGQASFELSLEEEGRTVVVFLGGPAAEATPELFQQILDSVR